MRTTITYGCIALLGSFALKCASASSLPEYPFLFEAGQARADVAPDTALIDVGISSRGADAAKVLDVVNASATEVFGALNRAKVRQADIESSGLERSLDRSLNARQEAAPMYVISRHLKVRLRDLSTWSTLMSDLARMKNIDSLNADFQTTARKSIEADLELKAAHDAEAKATRVAGAFGRKVGAVMGISEVPFDALQRTMTEDNSGRAYAPLFIPPAGLVSEIQVPAAITLQKNVNVLFKLE